MRTLVAAVAALALAGPTGAADDKIDAKKLIGRWEPAKADEKTPKMILTIEDKGRLSVSVTLGDKTETVAGAYKLDGNKMEVALAFGNKTEKDTLTIVKLTDTELVTKDSNGKEEALKRVKAK